MTKNKRRQFTPKLKADAVKLVQAGGRIIGQAARDLDQAEKPFVGGFGGLRSRLARVLLGL